MLYPYVYPTQLLYTYPTQAFGYYGLVDVMFFIPREFINLFGFAHERMVSPLQQPMATVPCEADGAVDLRPLYNS